MAVLPDNLRQALQVQTHILRLKGSVAAKQWRADGERGVAIYAALQELLTKGKVRKDKNGRLVVMGVVGGKGYRSILEKEEDLPVLVSLFRDRKVK